MFLITKDQKFSGLQAFFEIGKFSKKNKLLNLSTSCFYFQNSYSLKYILLYFVATYAF